MSVTTAAPIAHADGVSAPISRRKLMLTLLDMQEQLDRLGISNIQLTPTSLHVDDKERL